MIKYHPPLDGPTVRRSNKNPPQGILAGLRTYRHRKVVVHQSELLLREASDEHLVGQAFRFLLGMLQDTELIVTLALLFLLPVGSRWLHRIVVEGRAWVLDVQRFVARKQEEVPFGGLGLGASQVAAWVLGTNVGVSGRQ